VREQDLARGVERQLLLGGVFADCLLSGLPFTRKVDVRLPGKGNSNLYGARPVHLIITMIK